jgi:hypothetical protein
MNLAQTLPRLTWLEFVPIAIIAGATIYGMLVTAWIVVDLVRDWRKWK